MKSPANLTAFNYLILGLLSVKSKSGYALMRDIRETPMGKFSDSPGSVYPALRKLESLRLIESVVVGGGARRTRRAYRVSSEGSAELQRWLGSEMVAERMLRHPDELLLRISFAPHALGKARFAATLSRFGDDCARLDDQLARFVDAAKADLAPEAEMAFDLARQLLRTLRSWASNRPAGD